MNHKSQLGRLGENLTCKYFIEKGYKIIERNFRRKWGELDIIVKSPDKTLIFIEVKTMREYEAGLKPEDQLTNSKLKKLKKTASLYAGHNQELIDDDKGWRIDLLALTIKDKSCVIKHYENIVA